MALQWDGYLTLNYLKEKNRCVSRQIKVLGCWDVQQPTVKIFLCGFRIRREIATYIYYWNIGKILHPFTG